MMRQLIIIGLLVGATVASAQTPQAEAHLITPRPYLYVGESMPLILELTTRDADIDNLNLNGLPTTDNLSIAPSFNPGPVERRSVDGRVEETRRYATQLTGKRPGIVRFNTVLDVMIGVTRRTGFMTTRSSRSGRIKIPMVSVEVRPLPPTPEGQETISAIGALAFSVTPSSTNVAVGDLITVRMELAGEGNLDQVTLPELHPTPNFRLYPAKVVETSPTRIVKEQIIVPQSAQARAIAPVSFSWFDTTTESYQTKTFGPFALTFHEQQSIDASIFKPIKKHDTSAESDLTHGSSHSESTEAQIPARLAPSSDAAQLFIIPADAPFRRIRTYGEWQTVEYEGRRGWIPLTKQDGGKTR
jgi:hypothetical protein